MMILRSYRSLCAALLLFVPGVITAAAESTPVVSQPGSSPPATGWHDIQLDVSGRYRHLRVYVPQTFKPGSPALVLLHGGTQSMRKLFEPDAGGSQAWQTIADREGLLLLVPNGTAARSGDAAGDRQNWDDLRADGPLAKAEVDDLGFMRRLTDWARERYAYDPDRLYVSGASNGGVMTYRLLIEQSDRFAAGAAFVANLPKQSTRVRPPANPRALMIANGTLDRIMPFEGGQVGRMRGNVLSAADTLEWWVKANRADASAKQTEALPDVDPEDKCRIELTRHPAGSDGAPVWFYRLTGGGHWMPSIGHAVKNRKALARLLGPQCRDAEGEGKDKFKVRP